MAGNLKCMALAGLCLGAAACSSGRPDYAIPDLSDETQLSIAQGSLIGTKNEETGARAWYGIPFAAPPVDDLRWRAPRAPSAWDGILQANNKYSACLQYNERPILPGKKGDLVGSEDCLYLTVWAPGETPAEPLPVMVWVHGGANTTGYAGFDDFGRLAEQNDVIVVALNYRLGPMGWFANDAIRESALEPLDKSMNFALLDIIRGLDWVGENAEAFGGDPDRITLFGESAGGFNTAALMMSPQAEGKFHRAIVQSAGFNVFSMQEAETGPNDPGHRRGTSSAEAIEQLKTTGALPADLSPSAPDFAERLRAFPAETIFEAYRAVHQANALGGEIGPIDNTADGVLIPEAFAEPGNAERFVATDVPLIIGTNRDEALVAGLGNELFTTKSFGLIPKPRDKDAYAAHGGYPSRLWQVLGVQEPAQARSAALDAPVFTYRFDWDEEGSHFFTDLSTLVGAVHGLEVSFLSGEFSVPDADDKMFFKDETKASRTRLSSQMMSYWAEFARTGHPGGGTQQDMPEWQAYGDETSAGESIIFDTPADGGVRRMRLEADVESLLDDFRTDRRLSSDEQRCATADLMVELAKSQGVALDPFEKTKNTFCEKS